MTQTIKKMSLIGLILMIFTSVFGFANSPSAFYLMGYSAIPWYVFSALLFFIPFALMMAEMGSAYRKEEGGIYSWMNNSVGPRYAFIGTFMWFSSYVIWMVSTAAKVWVPFSTFLFGADMTQHWRIAGLEPTQVVGLLAVGWMILVTCVASRGINKIARITAVGGIAVMCLNLVLLLVSVAMLLLTGGHFAQDINFISSPNPGYQSGLAMLSFVVFAIFAYGGIEAVGGLVDKTEKPEKNFAKGIVFAAIVISVGYSLAIFLWGVSTNWQQVLSNSSVNLGNITYILMKSLGMTLGNALHLSPETAMAMGEWFARITGLSMFLAYTGAFFHAQLLAVESDYSGYAEGIVARTDDQTECGGNADDRNVVAVSVGKPVYPAGFVWRRYGFSVLQQTDPDGERFDDAAVSVPCAGISVL